MKDVAPAPEKVDFKKYFAGRNGDDPPAFFVVEASTHISGEVKERFFISFREKETLDVVLTIDGIVFPFEKTIEVIFKCFEKTVERKAAEMCREQLWKINDLVRVVEGKIVEEFGALDRDEGE